jgi:hypothetical protein
MALHHAERRKHGPHGHSAEGKSSSSAKGILSTAVSIHLTDAGCKKEEHVNMLEVEIQLDCSDLYEI